ncbi:peptidase inhibitor family I36 protein [Actinoplanes sp. NPDC051475]|uniref:peptidase inhibitor family I36 protein n=1 Tax=Actinoplanes sp. NPDC051475 TaxID=3157225 RepID=UPI00344B0BF2
MNVSQIRALRWRAALLLSVVLGVAASTSTASAADAAVGAEETCGFTRTVCLWENSGYKGARFTVQASNPDAGTCVDLTSHGWGSGRPESARNTGNRTATLYANSDCTGTSYLIPPGSSHSSIQFGSNSVFVY